MARQPRAGHPLYSAASLHPRSGRSVLVAQRSSPSVDQTARVVIQPQPRFPLTHRELPGRVAVRPPDADAVLYDGLARQCALGAEVGVVASIAGMAAALASASPHSALVHAHGGGCLREAIRCVSRSCEHTYRLGCRQTATPLRPTAGAPGAFILRGCRGCSRRSGLARA